MAYKFTFMPRFQKHFKRLSTQEKNQLKNQTGTSGAESVPSITTYKTDTGYRPL